MEQHPVPQHIASFQFKLFGNLTIRQFVTLAIPMSVAALIFFSNIAVVIRLPLSVLLGLFGLFISLVPVSGRPFEKWLAAFIRAIFSPTQRIWIKEEKVPEFIKIISSPPIKKISEPESITAVGKERLLAYVRSLPKENLTPLDIKEHLAIQRLALGEGPKGTEEGQLPPAILWPGGEPPEIPYHFRSSIPQVEEIPLTGTIQAGEQPFDETRMRIVAAPRPPETPVVGSVDQVKISTHAKPYILPGVEKKLKNRGAPRPQAHLASETNFAQELVIPIQTPDKNIRLVHGVGKTRVRKLHFAPPANFDLSKLPIHGERRFEISEELKKRLRFESSLWQESVPPVPPEGLSQASPAQEPVGQIPPEKKVTASQGVPKVTQFVPRANVNLETPPDVSLRPQETELTDSKISISRQKSKGVPLPSSMLERAQMVPLTNKPNVLSGLVTAGDGSPLVGVILTVRDINGIPLRALKTNKLGQFLSATPLANGQYSIEIEDGISNFKPIMITLTGQVLAPLEIKAEGGN